MACIKADTGKRSKDEDSVNSNQRSIILDKQTLKEFVKQLTKADLEKMEGDEEKYLNYIRNNII